MARRKELKELAPDLPPASRDLAQQLRLLYERVDLSMAQLGAALNCSRSGVSRFLSGTGKPDQKFINGFCDLADATPTERRDLLELLQNSRTDRGPLINRRAAATLGVTGGALLVAAAAGGWWYTDHRHAGGACQQRPIYIVNAYGNILGEKGQTIGVVDKGDVFVRDVSGTHERRYRFYGTVQGSKVTGYVLAQKLDYKGTRCITEV